MPAIAIKNVVIGDRVRRDVGDLKDLRDSMSRVGLLQPIVLDGSKNLIAGQRRLEAAKELDWTSIDSVVAKDVDDAVKHIIAERDENTCRLGFTPTEQVAVGLQIEKMEKPKAARRRKATQNNKSASNSSSGNLPEQGNTRTKAAAAAGMSERTYAKAKQVVQAAEEDPEKYGDLSKQMDRTGNVSGAFKKLEAIQCPPPQEPEDPVSKIVDFVKKELRKLSPGDASDAAHFISEIIRLEYPKDD